MNINVMAGIRRKMMRSSGYLTVVPWNREIWHVLFVSKIIVCVSCLAAISSTANALEIGCRIRIVAQYVEAKISGKRRYSAEVAKKIIEFVR